MPLLTRFQGKDPLVAGAFENQSAWGLSPQVSVSSPVWLGLYNGENDPTRLLDR